MINVLAAKFNQVDASIANTQSQIAALQTKLSELQDYRQQLLSVEQACESALGQVGTALAMLNHVDASQIGTFKAAVDAQFGTEAIGILSPADTTAEPTTPEPIAPTAPEPSATPDVESVIDVEVAATTEPAAPTEPESAPTEDIEQALNKMPLPSLRMLAKSKGTDARGTKANLAARLKKLVTPTDLRAIG